MTKEGSTKIENFMNPVAGVFMLVCGHISHYNVYGVPSTLSINITLVAIAFREYNLFFYATIDVYLLYYGAVSVQL